MTREAAGARHVSMGTSTLSNQPACVSRTAAIAALLGGINAGVVLPTALLAVCDTADSR
jgi:hypothetical protein